MQWIWQLPDWPKFNWDQSQLAPLEAEFQHLSGRRIGALRHLSVDERVNFRIEWLSDEAVETSAIEGEILDRDSVQSSIRRKFGLNADRKSATPAETSVVDMMVSLYQNYDQPLDHDTLWDWHLQLMGWRFDLDRVGAYRQGQEPMQIVSGDNRRVYYEAPPSVRVMSEMDRYIEWFNHAIEARDRRFTLTIAGISHLYFECIHPFEDGNGRIGRALAEKSIAQSLGQPVLIALSRQIYRQRKEYYKALNATNRSLDVTAWLVWISKTTIAALIWSERRLIRIIEQTQMFNRLDGQLNTRQKKVLLRLFKFEPGGFEGGLSAKNYSRITGASPSSVTRDLSDLVEKGALRRTGERRYTRYYLNLPLFEENTERLTVD